MRSDSHEYATESLQPAQAAKAVTLVELLVVAVVAGLAAMVVIPLAVEQRGLQLTHAARRIMADILYVQNQAIHERTPQALVFQTERGLYFYPSASNPEEPAIEPVSKKDYLILFGKACADEQVQGQSHVAEFPSVALESASFGGDSVLYFDWLGLPSAADGTPLSGAGIKISSGELFRTLTVETTTGRVTIN